MRCKSYTTPQQQRCFPLSWYHFLWRINFVIYWVFPPFSHPIYYCGAARHPHVTQLLGVNVFHMLQMQHICLMCLHSNIFQAPKPALACSHPDLIYVWCLCPCVIRGLWQDSHECGELQASVSSNYPPVPQFPPQSTRHPVSPFPLLLMVCLGVSGPRQARSQESNRMSLHRTTTEHHRAQRWTLSGGHQSEPGNQDETRTMQWALVPIRRVALLCVSASPHCSLVQQGC